MKKLTLSLVLTLGVSGFALACNQNNLNQSLTSSVEHVVQDDAMWCYITITVRNSEGRIINQWTEPYLVSDWEFGECNEIGRKRVAQLEDQLNK